MLGRALAATAVLLTAAWPLAVEAQEPPRRALVIGGPGSIGLLIPRSERWALRPDLSVALIYSKLATGTPCPCGALRSGLGMTLLRTLEAEEFHRTYLATRAAYSYEWWPQPNTVDHHDARLSVAFGIEARVTDRVGLFGEAGGQLRHYFYFLSSNRYLYHTELETIADIGITVRRRAPRS